MIHFTSARFTSPRFTNPRFTNPVHSSPVLEIQYFLFAPFKLFFIKETSAEERGIDCFHSSYVKSSMFSLDERSTK